MFKITALFLVTALTLTLGACTETTANDGSPGNGSPTGKIADTDVSGNSSKPQEHNTGAIGNSDVSGNNNTIEPGGNTNTGGASSNDR